MALPVEDTKLREQALIYVIRLYDELTAENGAPTLGTRRGDDGAAAAAAA